MRLLGKERRKYYRHPINAPLKLRVGRTKEEFLSQSSDVSLGGLSFVWNAKLPKGNLVLLSIPVKDKLFEIKGRVVYSVDDRKSGKYRTGIRFIDSPSAFRAKLAEEALEILKYRRTISRELGYEVSEEEAAKRWVQQFAKQFSEFMR